VKRATNNQAYQSCNHKFGTPIWDPDLGGDMGLPFRTMIWGVIWRVIWDPDLGPRFGTMIWDPDLGPQFGGRYGTPILDPDLGP
jgi:hypothetical protein